MESKYPYIDPKLIEYLDKLYPDVFPNGKLEEYQLGLKAGQVQLVRHLKTLLEAQIKASMKGITA